MKVVTNPRKDPDYFNYRVAVLDDNNFLMSIDGPQSNASLEGWGVNKEEAKQSLMRKINEELEYHTKRLTRILREVQKS